MKSNRDSGSWSEEVLSELLSELGETHAGRTVLVTGADGFAGSHLTEALVAFGAHVHTFVRATSSCTERLFGFLRGNSATRRARADRCLVSDAERI